MNVMIAFRKCKVIKEKFKCMVCRMQHNLKLNKVTSENSQKELEELIKIHEKKIIFSSYIFNNYSYLRHVKGKSISQKLKTLENEKFECLSHIQPLPIYLKHLRKEELEKIEENQEVFSNQNDSNDIIHFPYSINHTVISNNINIQESTDEKSISESTNKEIESREKILRKERHRWMMAYETYNDLVEEEEISESVNYGTPDPKSAISNVPCGGCGALLHCKDSAIPGYIPSEIYKNYNLSSQKLDLKSIVCQRCYFLKEFNTALQVRVSPDEYPKVLEVIKKKRALVLLLVDLLDFPSSIWPGISNLVGRHKPVIVVGNKVDLIPSDSKSYLKRIKEILGESVKNYGLDSGNIADVCLLSATTGWGVDELITRIHSIWGYSGDVYLVGCTNVGKSTLFNTLLQTDFCKVKATDLVQRATTSCWPGTTLNLLKFPILRPSGWKLYVRTRRLISSQKIASMERKLRLNYLKETRDTKYAMLIGHLDRTFAYRDAPEEETGDVFVMHRKAEALRQIGLDEKDPDFALSKWCYDTPGVVQPEQLVHLLTTEELTRTLPREWIRPFTVRVKEGTSILLGGVARLDYVQGPETILLTIFRSERLPVTVCETKNVLEVYETFLGTELLAVPIGNEQRLKEWPRLHVCNKITMKGVDIDVSCGDVVLSSAGWVSVTTTRDKEVVLQPWTPHGKGVFERKSILPFAVTLRGKKLKKSVAYKCDKIFLEN